MSEYHAVCTGRHNVVLRFCTNGLAASMPLIRLESVTCPRCLLMISWLLANKPGLLIYRKRSPTRNEPAMEVYEMRAGVSARTLGEITAECWAAIDKPTEEPAP